MARTTALTPPSTASTGKTDRQPYRLHRPHSHLVRQRAGKNNVDVIHGFARFVDAKTIEVNGETITADHILIATGGRPSHPNIPAWNTASTPTFLRTACPAKTRCRCWRGLHCGGTGGVINGLGAEAHLFVRKHAPLRSFDPLIVDTLVEVMNTEGPTLHTNAVPKAW